MIGKVRGTAGRCLMPLLRYFMALALRAVLGLLGLALIAYGGVHVVDSAFVLIRAWNDLAESGSTPPLSFLLQHYGLYGGLTAVGTFMIVVAIRGAIARIRAGLPSDEEGVGTTPLSRLLNIVIYGAGFCFGAFSIAVSIGPGTQMAMLVAQGVTVQAKVLSYEPTSDPQIWDMRYQFTTKSGEIITDAMLTEPVKERPSMNLFSRGIAVTYVESDPSQHAVTNDYSHSSFVFFMVTRLAIALVGMWGLIKNISPTPRRRRCMLRHRAASASPISPAPRRGRCVRRTRPWQRALASAAPTSGGGPKRRALPSTFRAARCGEPWRFRRGGFRSPGLRGPGPSRSALAGRPR